MASRRGAKTADLGDVDRLLAGAKNIREKYKALKKRHEASKDGKVVAPAEIRKLVGELKKAIAEAHAIGGKPALAIVPSPPAGMTAARSAPRGRGAGRRQATAVELEAPRVVELPPPSVVPPAPRRGAPAIVGRLEDDATPILPAPRGRVGGALHSAVAAVDWCLRMAPRALAVLVAR